MKRKALKQVQFPSVPQQIGTTSGVRSTDGKLLLFRYGVVSGKPARWKQSYSETGLFVVKVDDLEKLGPGREFRRFDDWAAKYVKAYQLRSGNVFKDVANELGMFPVTVNRELKLVRA